MKKMLKIFTSIFFFSALLAAYGCSKTTPSNVTTSSEAPSSVTTSSEAPSSATTSSEASSSVTPPSSVTLTVTGIEISTQPSKVEYIEGQNFDAAGLVVKKIMSDESKVEITDYTIDKTTLATTDTKVTVSFGEFSKDIAITVTAKTITGLEVMVDESLEYMRTMDITTYVMYRVSYSNGLFGTWEDVTADDISNYSVANGKLTATLSKTIDETPYSEQIEIPFTEAPISVHDLIAKTDYEPTYLVNGVLASFATTMGHTEVIVVDKTSGEFIGVTGLAGKGSLPLQQLDTRGLAVGDELIIPVKLSKADEQVNVSDSLKLTAQFVGGDTIETGIVSKANTISYSKANATVISNQAELVTFLTAENRVNNFYELVKLHGKVNYVYYDGTDSGATQYRFFFDGVTSYAEQKIEGNCSPCFSNGIEYYTTGKTVGELIWNDASYKPASWSDPGTATKDIYALFIGGNAYYHEFVILNENDVEEVTPVLKSTSFVKPTTLAYNLNETLDLTGAKVVYSYDYGADVEVPVTMAMLTASTLPNMAVAATYKVEGTYEGYEFSFEVSVTDKVATQIELVGTPTKTAYHVRETLDDVKDVLTTLKIKVTYNNGTDELFDITDNMISCADEFTIGNHDVKIEYLGQSTTVSITVENQGISVSEIKTKEVGDTVYDLHAIVIGSTFISGTSSAPANGELLVKDITTNEVIGVKGIGVTADSRDGGFAKGDEILVKVTVIYTSTTVGHSENGKVGCMKVADDTPAVLSQSNAYGLDTETAVVIKCQEDLDAFLANAETRASNAYKIVKICAGAKFASYSASVASMYITYTGTSSATSKIDGLNPFLHVMNESTTLGTDTYLATLFGSEATSSTFSQGGHILEKDVYFMYVGGQGTYYHQFILLGTEYITNEASKNVKEIELIKPDKLTYKPNETLDLTGAALDISYYYSVQDETVTLTSEHVTSAPIDMSVEGTYEIEFTYADKKYQFEIKVVDAVVTSIEINTMPTLTTYGHMAGVEDLDLTGGKIKVNYNNDTSEVIDMSNDMLPIVESADWKIGVVNYDLTYGGKTVALPIVFENRAKTVSQFYDSEIALSSEVEVTGVVVGATSTGGYAELILKETTSHKLLTVTSIKSLVGAYKTPALDTETCNIGDEIVITVTKVERTGVGVGHIQGKGIGTDGATSELSIKVLSHNNDVSFDLDNVVTISNQEELIAFLNSSDRFLTMVKFTSDLKVVKGDNRLRIFFGDEITSLTEQKVNEASPVFYGPACNSVDIFTPFTGISSETNDDFTAVGSRSGETYALFLTGYGTTFHTFVIWDSSWFAAPAI